MTHSSIPIPKMIHQFWIGPKPAPLKMMQTWRDMHPDCEYILWTEEEFVRRGITFRCTPQIDLIAEINGKADILRWEILYQFGGVAIDADSVCICPLDDTFWHCAGGFATYENESMRGDLVATGTMGFPPGHPLVDDILTWIASPDSYQLLTETRAWNSVGPGVLTRFLQQNRCRYSDVHIFPSYLFLPIHFTGGDRYAGHRKVYGYQAWGTAHQSYDSLHTVDVADLVPAELFAPTDPARWVSILVASYNTPARMVRDCLDSIRDQNGYLGFELVWVNDGSDAAHTAALEQELARFEAGSRFCRVVTLRTSQNRGIAAALRQGVELCTCDLVVRMDADDLMVSHRIISQYTYMMGHADAVVCGAGIRMFDDCTGDVLRDVAHPPLTWDQFRSAACVPAWILNQPATIFRREAVLAVGNYDPTRVRSLNMMEDYDLWLRLLRQYGRIDNVPGVLVMYRVHADQATQKLPSTSPECVALREHIVAAVLDMDI